MTLPLQFINVSKSFNNKKVLDEVKPNDISPVDLIRQAVGKFYLSEEEITEIIKERYKF